jgi:hypothetical protein
MGFVIWLRRIFGALQEPLSRRLPRTKAQADRQERVKIGDKQTAAIKLARGKKPRNRLTK